MMENADAEPNPGLNHPHCDLDSLPRESATLLSRLADAVDGQRTGTPVVFVASYRYHPEIQGHRVIGPFENCNEASDYRDLHDLDPKEFGVFGPFYTKPPEERTSTGKEPLRLKRVIVHLEDQREICLDGTEYDNIFWSSSSIDRFVLPYYRAIGAVEETQELREEFGDACDGDCTATG